MSEASATERERTYLDQLGRAQQQKTDELLGALAKTKITAGAVTTTVEVTLDPPIHLALHFVEVDRIDVKHTRYEDGELTVEVRGYAYPLRTDGKRKRNENPYWISLATEAAHLIETGGGLR